MASMRNLIDLVVLTEASDDIDWDAATERIWPQIETAYHALSDTEQDQLRTPWYAGNREPLIRWARLIVPDAYQEPLPRKAPPASAHSFSLDDLGYADRDPRTQFLAVCNFWATEVQGNDYETGYKLEAETMLLSFKSLASRYTEVEAPMLYRGTRGMSRQQAAAIIRNRRSIAFDLAESQISSWTIDAKVAERFASKNGGIVLRFPTSSFQVFLNFQALWQQMSAAEKTEFAGIHWGSGEAEILVINPSSLMVTPDNIHRFKADRAIRDRSKG